MASRSKCTQIFALLGAIFVSLLMILVFLHALMWFPISETFGLEVEKSRFVDISGINVTAFVFFYSLILIISFFDRKITLEKLQKGRESFGQVLFGVIVTLSGVSMNLDY